MFVPYFVITRVGGALQNGMQDAAHSKQRPTVGPSRKQTTMPNNSLPTAEEIRLIARGAFEEAKDEIRDTSKAIGR